MDELLQRQLLAGEHVLWSGRSSGRWLFRGRDVFLIPFSLLWTGFALVWNVTVWAMDGPLDFKLFGLPFLIIGAYFTFGRFIHDRWLRSRLIYGVTDKRVLIVRRGAAIGVKSLDLDRLPGLELTERPNGSGSIRFGAGGSVFGTAGLELWLPTLDATPQFLEIEAVRQVYDLIQRQRDTARAA